MILLLCACSKPAPPSRPPARPPVIKVAPSPERMLAQPERGGLDEDEVRSAVASRVSELQACYVEHRRTDPDLRGRVTFVVTISPAGDTSVQTEVDADAALSAEVLDCTVVAIEGWSLPNTDADEEFVFSVVFEERESEETPDSP